MLVSKLVTRTEPNPNAKSPRPVPTGILAVTRFVLGSILVTCAESDFTQTASAPNRSRVVPGTEIGMARICPTRTVGRVKPAAGEAVRPNPLASRGTEAPGAAL